MVVEHGVLASWVEWVQMALASLMVVEQRGSASWVEQAQMALAFLDRFCSFGIVSMESHAKLPN